MHAQFFTEAECRRLAASPYVASVTEKTVRFNEAFRQRFQQMRREGISPREIFLQCDIDPDILGETRMRGITYAMDKQRKAAEAMAGTGVPTT